MTDLVSSMITFAFILAIVFGALEVSGVFKKKQVNIILALAFAFYAMLNPEITAFLQSILPYAILLFIAFFFISFFFKLGGGSDGNKDYALLVIVLVLVLILIANYGIEFIEDLLPGISSDFFIGAIGVVVMLVIFYYVYKLAG